MGVEQLGDGLCGHPKLAGGHVGGLLRRGQDAHRAPFGLGCCDGDGEHGRLARAGGPLDDHQRVGRGHGAGRASLIVVEAAFGGQHRHVGDSGRLGRRGPCGQLVPQAHLGRDHWEAGQVRHMFRVRGSGREHRQAIAGGEVGGELDQVAQLHRGGAYAVLGHEPCHLLGDGVPGPGGRLGGTAVQGAGGEGQHLKVVRGNR